MAGEQPQESRWILIVDDTESLRRIISRVLEDEGYKPVVASNGQEALKLATECSFDLVLMDIEMPVLDGIQALIRLKKIQPKLPVLMMTAGERHREVLGLCEGILKKPFTTDEMLSAIQRLWKG